MFIWIIVAIAAVFVLWIISAYNGLIMLKNQTLNGWKQIDVQLKRRHDLIPNLVETVKGAMKFEQTTLTQVIEARNRAIAAQGVADKAVQENALTGALRQLFALAENYPDLKSNQNVAKLQEELSSTENKIAFARQAYNDTVMEYNTKRESFPDTIFAGMFGFAAATLLEATESAEERKAPKVSFK